MPGHSNVIEKLSLNVFELLSGPGSPFWRKGHRKEPLQLPQRLGTRKIRPVSPGLRRKCGSIAAELPPAGLNCRLAVERCEGGAVANVGESATTVSSRALLIAARVGGVRCASVRCNTTSRRVSAPAGQRPKPARWLVADRAGQLTAQDRVLVPLHEQSRVLGSLATQQYQRDEQQPAGHLLQPGHDHAGMIPASELHRCHAPARTHRSAGSSKL
ncbi:hypothetical protein A8926_4103 [Saccharopolyspora spinosa]|uniref:Uncharacterized protein n=1 Tax=Saccharopolyspora spinosa TaxID=60894 RepID=A0A2N3Y039_SACSN|nr:hypothetical protein A8926_4103 [Saccharopolyspora spinosa]